MTDNSDASGAFRLSNAERDRAVAALQSHAADGRLTEDEVQARVQSARTAVTRGDLAPLFADLPRFVAFDDAAPSAAAPPGAAQPGSAASFGPPAAYGSADGYGTRDGYGPGRVSDGRPFGRNGYVIVSIVPFIALILFFLTSWIWGFAYSWLWFLLIPIVGVIVYGSGYEGRERDRNRNR